MDWFLYDGKKHRAHMGNFDYHFISVYGIYVLILVKSASHSSFEGSIFLFMLQKTWNSEFLLKS